MTFFSGVFKPLYIDHCEIATAADINAVTETDTDKLRMTRCMVI